MTDLVDFHGDPITDDRIQQLAADLMLDAARGVDEDDIAAKFIDEFGLTVAQNWTWEQRDELYNRVNELIRLADVTIDVAPKVDAP